ncbi:MAG: catalase family protein [Pseudomonadota bacterium]
MTNQLLAQETIPAGEAAYIDDLGARLQAKIMRDNAGGIMRRDAHPKMHGLVKAEFTVEANLPQELRVGVFAEPKTYQAWIRFSNQDGTIGPDSGRDIRGMAIKLMGVPGEKLLAQEKDAQTQDFIVISTDRFVTADVEQFDALIKAFTSSLLAKAWFGLTHLRVLWNLFLSMRRFANPLQIRYFSTTPYLLGSQAVKYSAIPHVTDADAIPADPGPDYLREAMLRQLATGEAHFDFAVQLQTDARSMPIEDPGVAWSEQASPFRKVASIRIMSQQFDSPAQRQFGENMSFTPWHSLPQHRPLGGINRARKVVYAAISTFRHQANGTVRAEPAGWDIK